MSVTELYRYCVGLYGMSPWYFKTELRPREAEAYLDGAVMRRRDGWERARWLLAPYRTKEDEPVVFPWERASESTEEDLKRSEEEDAEFEIWRTKVAEMMKRRNGQGDSSETGAE